jgi:hypothetical protein
MFIVRVLITMKPRMYREAVALALHEHRPDTEIMLAPTEALDEGSKGFVPHVLLRNDTDGAVPEDLQTVVCRIEVMFTDSLDAKVSLDGKVSKVEDISIRDLIGILDETEGLILEMA